MPPADDDDDLQPWEAALALCEEIRELLDELPDRADDFRDSVGGRIDDMAEWIADNEHVTDAQQRALENMKAGCKRWLENEWDD